MSIVLLLSSISNPNWILYSFWVKVALFKELALGGIFGIINIVRFGFDSGVLLGVQVKYSLAYKVGDY
jgi:hypothetical protein